MLLEFSSIYLPPEIHEIIGILLVVLVIIHLILNRKYLKSIPKGKYNLKRMVMLVINVAYGGIYFNLYFWDVIQSIYINIHEYWKSNHNLSSQDFCISWSDFAWFASGH